MLILTNHHAQRYKNGCKLISDHEGITKVHTEVCTISSQENTQLLNVYKLKKQLNYNQWLSLLLLKNVSDINYIIKRKMDYDIIENNLTAYQKAKFIIMKSNVLN